MANHTHSTLDPQVASTPHTPSGSHASLLDHEYDGIREYDNPTPGWWHLIFMGSVVFSVFYGVFFHWSPIAWTPRDVLVKAQNDEIRRQFAGVTFASDQKTMLDLMNDAKWRDFGSSVFKANCVSCHGADAQGVVGPNLTDNFWKNVKTMEDVPRVVADGAANGAMPAWKGRLHANEVVLVASYVASLRGKNLPSARAAEGVEIPPWPKGGTN